jgi:hypothetical protein
MSPKLYEVRWEVQKSVRVRASSLEEAEVIANETPDAELDFVMGHGFHVVEIGDEDE